VNVSPSGAEVEGELKRQLRISTLSSAADLSDSASAGSLTETGSLRLEVEARNRILYP
jgi:hypothetical protein